MPEVLLDHLAPLWAAPELGAFLSSVIQAVVQHVQQASKMIVMIFAMN